MADKGRSTDAPKPHILIVEDEEGLRFMLESKLYQSGYRVSVAATGLHGLQKLRSGEKYDLIISDMKMPRMTGPELFKEYKNLGGVAPFVILTGFPDRSKISEAIALGVHDVILKPIRHGDLINRITQLLQPNI